MPTLLRMILVIVVLGGGTAVGLAVLGVVAEPVAEEVQIDVTDQLPGR